MATGHIAGINSIPTSLSIRDDFNRSFNMNMGSTTVPSLNFWNTSIDTLEDFDSISSNFAGNTIKQYGMRYSANNGGSFTVGTPYLQVSDNWYLRTQFTNLKFNPWLSMSGMWGNVNSSSTTEVSSLYTKDNFSFKMGMLHTKTDFTPGLVTQVSGITSVWGEAGVKQGGFGFYAGVLPSVVSGRVQLTVPTSVDRQGRVNYTNYTTGIHDSTVGYMRFTYKQNIRRNIDLGVNGIYTTSGAYRFGVQTNIRF
jgi:hypothetical protein